MNVADVFTEAEDLLRQVAPDVASVPIYICDSGALPPGLSAYGTGCYGLYDSCLDLALQGELEAAGRWKGRGAAMLVNVAAIAEAVAHDEHRTRRKIIGTTAHELAHYLEDDSTLRKFPDREAIPAIGKFFADPEWWSQHPPPPGPSPAEIATPWHNHELRFIRASVHLRYRLQRMMGGVNFAPPEIQFAGERYSLRNGWAYVSALNEECFSRPGASIKSILATDPPPELVALFAADVAAWQAKQTTGGPPPG